MRTRGNGDGTKRGLAGMLGLALAATGAAAAAAAEDAGAKPRGSSVEVVFAIDTTGSMSGLIEAAKQKVWSIANEIAKGKPVPKIKMGLIAYRDRGDEYLTKVFDLSANLDKIYEELLSLKANGGGDGPEHVLKALEDAAERVSWDDDARTFKVLYLVGDAPAHLDYGDTPKLEELTERLVRKGVVVNTIQCGGQPDTTAQWRRIARLAEGKYLPIAHDGGVVTVSTPFDDRIAALSTKLEGTMLGYGEKRDEAMETKALSRRVAAAAPAFAAAERAAFKSGAGFGGEMDLVEAVEEGRVDLARVSDKELPDAFRELSPEDRRKKLAEVSKKRTQLRGEIREINKKRARYMKEHSGGKGTDSFDVQLVESLKKQASRKGIVY
ncbi:MAG: vWA domain-containing protein [Elusimicrobiota bacterium]